MPLSTSSVSLVLRTSRASFPSKGKPFAHHKSPKPSPWGKVSPQVTDEGGVSPEASGTLSTSSVSLKDFIFTWEISRQRYFGGRHASLRSAHTASCPAPPRGSLRPPKVPKAFHPPNARFHDTPSIGELQSSAHKKDRAKSPVFQYEKSQRSLCFGEYFLKTLEKFPDCQDYCPLAVGFSRHIVSGDRHFGGTTAALRNDN